MGIDKETVILIVNGSELQVQLIRRKHMSYRFFQNKECEYFPCHKMSDNQKKDFSCLFCYCPLYHRNDCGGDFVLLENGCKDCTNCLLPHFQYDYVVGKLKKD